MTRPIQAQQYEGIAAEGIKPIAIFIAAYSGKDLNPRDVMNEDPCLDGLCGRMRITPTTVLKTQRLAAIDGTCCNKKPHSERIFWMPGDPTHLPHSSNSSFDHGRVPAIVRYRCITSIQHRPPDPKPHILVPLRLQRWQLRSIRRPH